MDDEHLKETTLRLTEDSARPRTGEPLVAISGTVGRYEIGVLLGSGGMAEVYRAYDATLNRAVALKFLRETDDEHLERFMREARTQAQVGHDNICDVYETGTLDGRPFIAMQCIDGFTLAEAAGRMSVEEKVRVMADVAEAVHAAHRTGLVHRDLKPQNIMVEATAEGGWHPYVLDFGLARDQSMDTMTTIGAVMGTPPYMAPEQARGERAKIDRRTDVYSLGATLYDLLTGRPPFVADSSVATMMKLLSEEAPSLRTINPAIPADLDTIVMKCLEKDQQRRYDSARALAEELRRYLDGEPIKARPTTFAYRWMRRARKHPTIAALLAIATLAVLVSLAWAVVTSMQSAERQRAAQLFGQQIERIEATARYASMLPLHDIGRERQWIRQRIANISREKSVMGSTAFGPGDYAIGRGYLALHEWESSRRYLESAWSENYRTPEVAYALGRVIGAQYQQELEESERIANKDARAARQRQIEQQYREKALTFLRQSAGSGSESPAYVEGLIAFYEKRPDVALERARAAFAAVPWLFEAKKLEGDIWLSRGKKESREGNYDVALASFASAGTAYAEAESIGSSDADVLLGQAERWFQTMLVAIYRGDDPREAMQRGIAAAERAAVTHDELADSYAFRAGILIRFGEWQVTQGESPFDALDRGIAMARQTVTLEPKLAKGHSQIGNALFLKARWAATHGEDPLPLFDESIRSHRRAVALLPRGTHELIALANALRRKGEAVAEAGGSPLALLDESVVFYNRATTADPLWANSENDKGLAFMTRGEWEMENGRDPMKSFEASARSLERALAINPQFAVAVLNLGSVHLDRGNHILRTGGDPRAALTEAIRAYEHALTLNPKLAFARSNSGLANYLAAQYALDAGDDPRAWISRGSTAYAEALVLNPEHAASFAYGGLLHLLDAEYTARNGGDPRPALDKAREGQRQAEAINPNSPEFLQFAASIETEAARYELAQKRSPAAALAAADGFLARAMKINEADADTFYTRATVHRIRAEWKPSPDEIARGLAAVDRSLEIDKEKSEASALRGELLQLRGDRAAANAAFDRAIALKPSARKRWEAMKAH
jgi:eukaryotic-like serine/threonine-protein kinase